MPAKSKLTGRSFGRLTVIGEVAYDGPGTAWLCRCECGNEITTRGGSLTTGHTKSCGCLQRDAIRKQAALNQAAQIRHGKSGTKLYCAWTAMRRRCLAPDNIGWAIYGGRGISICKEWDSFEQFAIDMGDPPSPKHSLDRKDSNGNYDKYNCRWATWDEQCSNRRSNVIVEYKGKHQTVAAWAAELGMQYATLRSRIVLWKWSVEKAFNTPVRKTRRKYK